MSAHASDFDDEDTTAVLLVTRIRPDERDVCIEDLLEGMGEGVETDPSMERGIRLSPTASIELDQPLISRVVLMQDDTTRRVHWADITPLTREEALDMIHEEGGRTLVADGDETEPPEWFLDVDLVELRDDLLEGRRTGRIRGVAPLIED